MFDFAVAELSRSHVCLDTWPRNRIARPRCCERSASLPPVSGSVQVTGETLLCADALALVRRMLVIFSFLAFWVSQEFTDGFRPTWWWLRKRYFRRKQKFSEERIRGLWRSGWNAPPGWILLTSNADNVDGVTIFALCVAASCPYEILRRRHLTWSRRFRFQK